MKNIKIKFAFFYLIILSNKLTCQPLGIDTLIYNGDPDKFINIVIIGDGYTYNQQDTFIQDATNMITYFFNCSPWHEYRNYFNVFAIKVVSSENGCKHPGTAPDCNNAYPPVPITNPNTYFGCSFDMYNIHRLVTVTNYQAIYNVITQYFPMYDQLMVIANTPYYGGSGGTFLATTTMNITGVEILLHEAGHSFAGLADEYWAGPQFAMEKPNMTRESNPQLIKWKNWLTPETGIGIYPHTGDTTWFKPSNNCKMQALYNNFCSVCKEAIVEKIHQLVDPVLTYSPLDTLIYLSDSTIQFKLSLIYPDPPTLSIKWFLNSNLTASNTDSLILSNSELYFGLNSISAIIIDSTQLVRTDNHSSLHFSSVTWKIFKSPTTTTIKTSEQKYFLKIYPNPTKDFFTIETNYPEIKQIIFYNSIGNIVYHEKILNEINDNKIIINCNNLNKGLHFIEMVNNKNEKLSAKVIVN